jgi:tungstate transport system substrate-binding protein
VRYVAGYRRLAASGLAVAIISVALGNCGSTFSAEPETVRVAVIGGMVQTGFWEAVAERFEKATGLKVEVVAYGPKRAIAVPFEEGAADLITMHASDTIINLVADGYAVNPQPWLKNDLVLVGPANDPAHVRGMTDAAAAMKKIVSSGSPFVVHSSLGAEEVLRDVLETVGLALRADTTTFVFSDQARNVLKTAAEKKAYTLVGRIPFLNGRLPNAGLVLMVRGDPKLRRPYVVAVASRSRFPHARVEAATRLAEFLRNEETQQWIAGYGRGELDDQPIFFRVVVPPRK